MLKLRNMFRIIDSALFALCLFVMPGFSEDYYTVTMNTNGGNPINTNIYWDTFQICYEEMWVTDHCAMDETDDYDYSIGTGSYIEEFPIGDDEKYYSLPTRSGYLFKGYYSAPTGGVQYMDVHGQVQSAMASAAMDATGDFTIYAQWTPNTYTVTYACGTGATGNAPKNGTATYNANFTPAANSTCAKTGYAFAGWNDGTANWTPGTAKKWTYTSNKTLTAKWTPNIGTITLETDNRDATSTVSTLWTRYQTGVYTSSANAQSGTNAVSKIAVPVAPCADFLGFYDNNPNAASGYLISSDGTIQTLEVSELISTSGGSYSLFADWYLWPHTSMNRNGGNGGVDSLYFYDSDVYADSTCATALTTGGSVSKPSRTGYTFKGYYCVGWAGTCSSANSSNGGKGALVIDANGKITSTATDLISGSECLQGDDDINCSADWQANTYTITFDKRGGSGGATSTTATYDSSMPTVTSLPTKDGYVFAGWEDSAGKLYYNDDGTSAKGVKWDKTSNTTLYAKWTAGRIAIKWYGTAWQTSDKFTRVTEETNVWKSTVDYGGDIITPNNSSVAGFVGWKFVKPSN